MNQFKYIFRMLSKEKFLVASIIIFIFLNAIIWLLPPFFTKIIIDYILVNNMSYMLNIVAIIMILMILSRVGILFFQDSILLIFRQKVEFRALKNYFLSILKYSLEIFRVKDIGDLMNRMSLILDGFQMKLNIIFFFVFHSLFLFVLVLSTLAFINFKLFIITIIFLVGHLINVVLFALKMMEYINELIVSKGNNSAYLLNYYDGYIQILTSWQLKNFQDDFNQRIDKYMVTVNKLEFIEYLQAMIQQILIYAYTIFIFVFGGSMVLNNEISLGNLMLFYLMIGYVNDPIFRLTMIVPGLQSSLAELHRMYEIIDEPLQENINLNKDPEDMIIDRIHFENLSFSFPDNKTIFKNTGFTFEKNRIYMLFGPSGTGKTTLFYLLAGIYQPVEGQILINNQNFTDFPLESVRNRISFGLQENFIFSGKIVDNITCFNETTDARKIEYAADMSQSSNFILQLPHQYYSEVKENGNNLSGGQKQRLGLARLFYDLDQKDVLLLDEPTSSLDKKNEESFFNKLVSIKKDKIIIVITHKEENKHFADTAIYLKDNQLIIGE